MKKLLALLTAPLTMTACIDLTEEGTINNPDNPSVDAPGSDLGTETEDKGWGEIRAAYLDTQGDFVQPFTNDTAVSAKLASTATTNACLDVDAMKGNFNSTAAFSNTASEIMLTREGSLEDGAKKAMFEEDTSFFKDSYVGVTGHNYETNGYISSVINENGKIDLTSHEYLTLVVQGVASPTMIRVAEGITQVWGTGVVQDVIKLTDTIYAHREINDQGRKEIRVFNTYTGSTYYSVTGGWEADIDTGENCYVEGQDNDMFMTYIEEAKDFNWLNSNQDFDTVDKDELFTRPTFDHTEDEIEAKLA